MRPTSTTYRLANPGGEYNRLYALMAKEGFGQQALRWPVVVAERDDRVIGFLGTWDIPDAIIAGPAVIEGGRNMLMLIRLAEAYEAVLRLARIGSYHITVERGNSAQVERVQRIGYHRVGEDENYVWFKRTL